MQSDREILQNKSGHAFHAGGGSRVLLHPYRQNCADGKLATLAPFGTEVALMFRRQKVSARRNIHEREPSSIVRECRSAEPRGFDIGRRLADLFITRRAFCVL